MVDRVADRVAHLPHLPIPSFADRDDECRVVGFALRWQDLHLGGSRSPAVDHQTAGEPIEIVRVRHAEDARLVNADDAMAWVRQPRRQVAVIGEQQQPLRLVIEAAHRVDVLADTAQQIDDRRPPLRIGSGRHIPARLVQQQVAVVLDDLHTAAIDADVVPSGIRLRPKLEGGDAVHAHASLAHHLLRRAPRCDAGLRQDLLQPFHCQKSTTKTRKHEKEFLGFRPFS